MPSQLRIYYHTHRSSVSLHSTCTIGTNGGRGNDDLPGPNAQFGGRHEGFLRRWKKRCVPPKNDKSENVGKKDTYLVPRLDFSSGHQTPNPSSNIWDNYSKARNSDETDCFGLTSKCAAYAGKISWEKIDAVMAGMGMVTCNDQKPCELINLQKERS